MRVAVATGFRPDLSIFRDLRVALDAALECPSDLAPMIDPNLHSCGTVPPHGAVELAHPEPGFYVAGMKSYGCAPTFLLATGNEQVRSIVAEIVGDHAAAQQKACCGGLAVVRTDACCAKDELAKDQGKAACGCAVPEVAAPPRVACCG